MKTSVTLPSGLIGAALLLSPLALAQQQLAGPVMGYAADASSGALYRVNGLPGASYLSRLGAGPAAVKMVRISQKGRLALVLGGETAEGPAAWYAVRGLDRPDPDAVRLTGEVAEPSLVAFCGSGGDSAILYSERAGTLQLVRGLRGEQPEVLAPVELAGAGRVSSIACHNAAQAAVFTAGEEGSQGLYSAALGADGLGEPKLAGRLGTGAGIAPFENGLMSLVLDRAGNRLLAARHGASGSGGMIESIEELAGGAEGINQPVGVAVTDSGLAAVANAGSASVLVYDVRSRQMVGLPLEVPAAPTQCERLAAGDVFALTSPRPGAPFYTIDLAAEPRVVFTPAFHGDSQQ